MKSFKPFPHSLNFCNYSPQGLSFYTPPLHNTFEKNTK
nr:MAG TPA: hypothetical protein [Caudoviricetes sp.]